jgi:hypothetical protein
MDSSNVLIPRKPSFKRVPDAAIFFPFGRAMVSGGFAMPALLGHKTSLSLSYPLRKARGPTYTPSRDFTPRIHDAPILRKCQDGGALCDHFAYFSQRSLFTQVIQIPRLSSRARTKADPLSGSHGEQQ